MWHKDCLRPFQKDKLEKLLKDLADVEKACSGTGSVSDLNTSEAEGDRRSTRSSSTTVDMKNFVCFLCTDRGTRSNPLHRCETKEIDEHIKNCAESIGEWRTLGLLSEGDLIAQAGKYHAKCLVSLYNRARKAQCQTDVNRQEMACESVAFADLLSYMQSKLAESETFVFKMSHLRQQYTERLTELLGPSWNTQVPHSTRLRLKILAHLPNLKATLSGKEYLLMKKNANVIPLLQREDEDLDMDTLGFFRFVKTLRGILHAASCSFNGSYEDGCEREAVPPLLLATMNAILYGSSVGNDTGSSAPALKIAQLVLSNCKKSVPKGTIVRMDKSKETPLLSYIGLSNYCNGRGKSRIDEMHQFGMSISSDRVMEIISQVCRLSVRRASEEGVLLPSILRHGLFTVAHVDNFDARCRSTTGKNELHGTGISIMQIPSRLEKGSERIFASNFQDVASPGCRSVLDLPSFYADVPEVILPNRKAANTKCSASTSSNMLDAGL